MIEVFDFPQGSDEWHLAHLGIPTASQFATVMASGVGGEASKTRALYMKKLAGEIISGVPRENYRNASMDRGNVMEPEARDLYCMMTNADVAQVGFVRNGRIGCSPDGLVGADGAIELKTQAPHLLIDRLFAPSRDIPAEHVAQCQGTLLVCEREWIQVGSYFSKMPLWLSKKTFRNEAYIAKLNLAISVFLEELDEMVDKIRNWQ